MNQNDFDFKLKDKEKIFTISFSNKRDFLKTNISEKDSVSLIYYSANFSLTEWIKHSRYFKLFGSIEELIPEIKNLSNQNQVKISKEKIY